MILNMPITKLHKVEKHQTLYSISRMYGMNLATLKKINMLKGSLVKIKQLLVVEVVKKVKK